MYQLKHILLSVLKQRVSWRNFLWDTLTALLGTLAVTMILYGLHLYPRIPNISLVYLVVVLTLASTRGLYPAVLSSVVAFLSFDFFLVQPLYTFTIRYPEEWLALGIFLCTAIITGQLAAALRQRAEQARERERETRILYELLRDTNNEEDLDHQLEVLARTVVEVFASRGVRNCMLLLPDEGGKPVLRASAQKPLASLRLTTDELSTAAWVMREGQTVELYDFARAHDKASHYASRVVIRSSTMPQSSRRYLSFFPLKTGQKVIGVLCLSIEEDPRLFTQSKRLGSEANHSDPSSRFFWAFLDQATSMVEHARLRRESLQVEVLQRTDALRAALISSVSHDLRTPLTSIKAAASSLLQNDIQWSEEERHSFSLAIEHEADRLNRLVENLLDISRIEGGALKPEKEWYPIDEILHDVLGRMKPLLQRREVKIDLPADLPPVELDYLMIDQVLTNLLENALRYTPAGSPIEIAVMTNTTELTVSVADHGPGIPAGDLERIFDKFYRVTGPAHKMGGTGIGLAVCRGLIEAHGGRIWAENRRGGGAVFSFTLPLHRAERVEAQIEEARI
ncbi:MAG TPA: ATP-binding protein [Ktedonobacteraceae bacterium]|nr:ATP-binding protein [Ktedonobacteraceae bacterium]